MSKAPDWFVVGVMAKLATAYPSWQCHAGTIQVFWDALCDIERRNLERACASHIAHETSWPVAARLRQLAQEHDTVAIPTPGEAWEEMYRHRHLHTRNPKWSHPAIERAAEAVRWNDPDWLASDIPTIRAQFERYYKASSEKIDREKKLVESDYMVAMTLGVAKDAKALYGHDYKDPEEPRHRKPFADDVDPPQIDDLDE